MVSHRGGYLPDTAPGMLRTHAAEYHLISEFQQRYQGNGEFQNCLRT